MKMYPFLKVSLGKILCSEIIKKMMGNICYPLYRCGYSMIFLLLLFTLPTTLVHAQPCPQSVEVVVEGERCAGNGDGKAKVVINGQVGSGTTPLSCESPLSAQESCESGCSRTYSSNSGELVITSGERVCLISTDFRGGIQASGGTLVVCGSMTPSYFNLNGSNPGFTLVVLGSANLQALNLFGNSLVKNYGTITVSGSIGFNGELINEGTLNVSGDVSVNAPYGKITNRGTLQVGTNLNVYNRLYNGGTITVSGTVNNNSGGGIENNCTLTIGGDFNNNVTTVNRGKIKVTGTGRMNGPSRYEGYGGSLLETSGMTVDGIVMGKSVSCAAIKVSGNTIINSSATFSGKIDYCDGNGIETNTGQWTAPAVHDCSCTQGAVNAIYS